MTTNIPPITVIFGPTASGKSALALELAEKTGGVIINADSQQIYRECPILTARPTPDEEARAPHKLYGALSVSDHVSAGIWLKLAKMEIDWALSQGKPVIVVGGTGLYIKALMEGMVEMPSIPPQVRAQATSDYEQMGKVAFAERLRAVDPQFFERLKVQDKQRLIRAYEVWLGSGKPLSYWQSLGANPPYAPELFHLRKIDLPREEIYRRCDERFVKMIEQGAVEEVRELKDSGFRIQDCGIIGVKELGTYLDGEMLIEQAIEKGQQLTRNYAKRQMTWGRNQLQLSN